MLVNKCVHVPFNSDDSLLGIFYLINQKKLGNLNYSVIASSDGSATPSWYKLPANAFGNDDTKVTQTNTATSSYYRVLFSGNANDDTETTTARKSTNL
jgi:hypothetical protein